MARVVSFGELMIRLQPYHYERFVQANNLEFTFGGAEANTSVSLANFGVDAAYVTKLPNHVIGQCAVNALRRYGVDTSMIVRGGDRVGIYFNEKGASQRPGLCVYDRAHSAISEAVPEDFDWDIILEGADWFYFTGITPALGPKVAELCRAACLTAREKGIRVACDLNYRAKLWTIEQAREVMGELCRYVDLFITNETQARELFSIEAGSDAFTGGRLNDTGAVSVARQLSERFGFELVAVTRRSGISASDNEFSAVLFDAKRGETGFSKVYPLRIVDRIGGGDSFDAGLIYSLLNGKDVRAAVVFAAAACAWKHSIEGDFNFASVEEIEQLAGGDGSGRVQR